jgi:hypothetical protein
LLSFAPLFPSPKIAILEKLYQNRVSLERILPPPENVVQDEFPYPPLENMVLEDFPILH